MNLAWQTVVSELDFKPMSCVAIASPELGRIPAKPAPRLENGDHLTATEFLRRYEAMPEVKKAELIQGKVYLMASPVRLDVHGYPDAMVQAWLGGYAMITPRVRHAVNSTTLLGPDDVPQPDGMLHLLPACGGQSKLSPKGYLSGAPELAFEIAASSSSYDLHEKRDSYRRAGVREYLVWRTLDGEMDAWSLVEESYQTWKPGEDGILRSAVFPGLWLDVRALILEDGAAVLATLSQGLASPEYAQFARALRSALAAA